MGVEQIALLSIGAILLVLVIVFYLSRKNYFKYSKIVQPVLKAILDVLKGVGGLFPANSTINIITKVVSAAVTAAGFAEKLWLEGSISKAERPECARDYITNLLQAASIEITSNIQTIIDGAIAITCYLMPHHENKEE